MEETFLSQNQIQTNSIEFAKLMERAMDATSFLPGDKYDIYLSIDKNCGSLGLN